MLQLKLFFQKQKVLSQYSTSETDQQSEIKTIKESSVTLKHKQVFRNIQSCQTGSSRILLIRRI